MSVPAEKLAVPMSARAFALSIGAVPRRVQAAIKRGKLRAGVETDASGRAMIVDPDAARTEWAARGSRGSQRTPEPHRVGAPYSATAPIVGELLESRRGLYAAQKERIEQALAERRGDLVSAAAVERMVGGLIVAGRTRVLSVPSRLRQRFPELDATVFVELDRLLREALEELATQREPIDE